MDLAQEKGRAWDDALPSSCAASAREVLCICGIRNAEYVLHYTARLLGESGRGISARMLRKNSKNLAFGRALRRLRKDRQATQQDLAVFARLDRTFISLLERGENSPSLLTMLAICRGLDISLTEMAAEIERELGETRPRKQT